MDEFSTYHGKLLLACRSVCTVAARLGVRTGWVSVSVRAMVRVRLVFRLDWNYKIKF